MTISHRGAFKLSQISVHEKMFKVICINITAPVMTPLSAQRIRPYTAQKYSDPDGGSAQESKAQHKRQFSSTSLEHSLQEVDRNLQDMLIESGKK